MKTGGSRSSALPLVAFLLAGLAIFAVDRWLGSGVRERRIRIGTGEIERLVDAWQGQAQRPPTPSELETLIADRVREEVLVREARRFGLDQDDVIIRRRLAQKMSFFLEDREALPDPSEAELKDFFVANQDRWSRPARVSFVHVYFSEERDPREATKLVRRTLLELRNDAVEWRLLGDPFMLQRELADRSYAELAELFGSAFADAVLAQPIGEWRGPLRSAFGQHLVRVSTRRASREVGLEEVRARVLQDFRVQRRREANDEALRRLIAEYEVEIDDPGGGVELELER